MIDNNSSFQNETPEELISPRFNTIDRVEKKFDELEAPKMMLQFLKRKESKDALLIARNKVVEDIMTASLEDKASFEDKAGSLGSFGSRNLEFPSHSNLFYSTTKVENLNY